MCSHVYSEYTRAPLPPARARNRRGCARWTGSRSAGAQGGVGARGTREAGARQARGPGRTADKGVQCRKQNKIRVNPFDRAVGEGAFPRSRGNFF